MSCALTPWDPLITHPVTFIPLETLLSPKGRLCERSTEFGFFFFSGCAQQISNLSVCLFRTARSGKMILNWQCTKRSLILETELQCTLCSAGLSVWWSKTEPQMFILMAGIDELLIKSELISGWIALLKYIGQKCGIPGAETDKCSRSHFPLLF